MAKPHYYNYTPGAIMILSSGYCGSTCSVIARHLQEHQPSRVRTLVVGGILNVAQSIASFPGGQSYDLASLLQDIAYLNISHAPYVVDPLPTSASLGFTLREIYSWAEGKTDIPLEFVVETADFHMPLSHNSYNNDSWLFWEANVYFDICNSNFQTRYCKKQNGYGSRQCNPKTGQYYPTCLAVGCDYGYYLLDYMCVKEGTLSPPLVKGIIYGFVLGMFVAFTTVIVVGTIYIWKKKRQASAQYGHLEDANVEETQNAAVQ